MQTLISVLAILSVATGARLTLLPYAYLADPHPVYYQSQDTRAGVHSFSYAGGPSAKEEIRGPDGVTRGSYSYIDANGFLQSVFYVADEDGFRVAATNLPSNGGNLPYDTSEILLAKAVVRLETAAREEQKQGEENASGVVSRGKRSLDAQPAADQDRQTNQASSSEDPQRDQANQADPAIAPKSSHEVPAEKSAAGEGRTLVPATVYAGLLDTVLIPRLIAGTATSQQSRVDVHSNIRLKAVQPAGAIVQPVLAEPVLLSGQAPLQASSSQQQQQQQLQENNLRIDALKKEVAAEAAQSPSLVKLVEPIVPLVPLLPDYNENRIQLHKNLGLEGPNRQDAVKIDAATRLAIVEETPAVAATVPIVKAAPLSVATAVSSQNRVQVHNNAKLVEVEAPPSLKPSLYVAAASYAQPLAALPIWASPVVPLSGNRQTRSSEKIDSAKN